jgi:hypothetical protein
MGDRELAVREKGNFEDFVRSVEFNAPAGVGDGK